MPKTNTSPLRVPLLSKPFTQTVSHWVYKRQKTEMLHTEQWERLRAYWMINLGLTGAMAASIEYEMRRWVFLYNYFDTPAWTTVTYPRIRYKTIWDIDELGTIWSVEKPREPLQ